MSLKVKQGRVGPTFVSSAKDIVTASNSYVHCSHYYVLLSHFVKMKVCEHRQERFRRSTRYSEGTHGKIEKFDCRI